MPLPPRSTGNKREGSHQDGACAIRKLPFSHPRSNTSPFSRAVWVFDSTHFERAGLSILVTRIVVRLMVGQGLDWKCLTRGNTTPMWFTITDISPCVRVRCLLPALPCSLPSQKRSQWPTSRHFNHSSTPTPIAGDIIPPIMAESKPFEVTVACLVDMGVAPSKAEDSVRNARLCDVLARVIPQARAIPRPSR